MSDNGKKLDPPDLRDFHQNRHTFPLDELDRYAGQYVAWSPDGLRILAVGATEQEMEANLTAAGIDPSQVVGEYLYPPDMVL